MGVSPQYSDQEGTVSLPSGQPFDMPQAAYTQWALQRRRAGGAQSASTHPTSDLVRMRDALGNRVAEAVELAQTSSRDNRLKRLWEQTTEVRALLRAGSADQIEMGRLNRKLKRADAEAERVLGDGAVFHEARTRLIEALQEADSGWELARLALEEVDRQIEAHEQALIQFLDLRVELCLKHLDQVLESMNEAGQVFLTPTNELGRYLGELQRLEAAASKDTSSSLADVRRGRINQLHTTLRAVSGDQAIFDGVLWASKLAAWLASFARAAATPPFRQQIGECVHTVEARVIDIIEHFCARQEVVARKVVRAPDSFKHPNAWMTLLLSSERLLLESLCAQDPPPPTWLASVTRKKLGELDRLEPSLIAQATQ